VKPFEFVSAGSQMDQVMKTVDTSAAGHAQEFIAGGTTLIDLMKLEVLTPGKVIDQPSQGVMWNWWRQGMMGGAKAHYDGIVAFSQTDFTEDLKKITVPVLVMHGDDDQIVPYADSAPLSAKLLKNGTLKTYKGFPHGMPTTNADQINADLLTFFKGAATAASS
jgi:pimeloyl-ACP methyl ester carboxylesterase